MASTENKCLLPVSTDYYKNMMKYLSFKHVVYSISLLLISSIACAITPTPEQIQIFKNLPADQQSQLMKQAQETGAVTLPGTVQSAPVTKPDIRPEINQHETEAKQPEGKSRIEASLNKVIAQEGENLKQFGYDLFVSDESSFSPSSDIPVPTDYIVGPGDNIQIQLFGMENSTFNLAVSRDGTLNFPGIGVIPVAGMSFDQAKSTINSRLSKQFIGVQSNITMGALRSIRVFVLGDVIRPGSYTVSALSTMTNALFMSGGIKPIGSLRRIQLKRGGKLITTLDLYDLLMHGDTSADARLKPGDVIFVPSIGPTVGVAGEVIRPAIYELRNEKSIGEAIKFAGGMLSSADPEASQLERIADNRTRTVLDIDLNKRAILDRRVNNGDVVRVRSVTDRMENIVTLAGNVQRPGRYQWRQGLRLADVVSSFSELLPKPDTRYLLIEREMLPDRHLEVLTADLSEALAHRDSEKNVQLLPRDRITILGLNTDRMGKISAITKQLSAQTNLQQAELVVSVEGNVRYPGAYPFFKGMRVSDLIRAGVDIKAGTDMHYALVRRETGSSKAIEVFSTDIATALNALGSESDVLLQPRDKLMIFPGEIEQGATSENGYSRVKEIEQLMADLRQQSRLGSPPPEVSLLGSVKHAGTYPLERNMRVADLIRAGSGLLDSAYINDAELVRYSVMGNELRQMSLLKVNLSEALKGNESENVVLQPYDRLHIKQLPAWSNNITVELKGEVRHPGKYSVRQGELLSDLIKRAGGLTVQAYPEAAFFSREELKQTERKNIEEMSNRLKKEIAELSLDQAKADPDKLASAGVLKDMLSQLEGAQATGRLVIDLPKLLAGDHANNVILKDGDMLVVPELRQEITVIGEVFYPTSHLFDSSLSFKAYVNQSGGMTKRADDDRIYIVKANGAVDKAKKNWYSPGIDLTPGDTIVVPLDTERTPPLRLWTSVTQIIYQLGIAAASWNAVGLFK